MLNESLMGINEKVEKDSLIYLGPNLPGSMLNRFAVYKNGMPKHLETVIDKCPDIERLFVSVVKLTEVLEKINKTGTPYNVWYNNVVEFAKKGVE